MKFYLQLSNVGLKEVRSETGVQAGGDATIPRSGWPTEMLGKIYSIVLVVDYAISTRLTRKAGMIHKLKTMGPRTNRPATQAWACGAGFWRTALRVSSQKTKRELYPPLTVAPPFPRMA